MVERIKALFARMGLVWTIAIAAVALMLAIGIGHHVTLQLLKVGRLTLGAGLGYIIYRSAFHVETGDDKALLTRIKGWCIVGGMIAAAVAV